MGPAPTWLYCGGYHLGRMGAKRTAVRRHRTNNQGGLPPYLRAVCRLMPSACRRHQTVDGGYYIWEPAPFGGGRMGMGAGGSPRQPGRISGVCAARPAWRGLPTAPKGGAEGVTASCLSVGFLLSVGSLFLSISSSSSSRAGTISHIYLYFSIYLTYFMFIGIF